MSIQLRARAELERRQRRNDSVRFCQYVCYTLGLEYQCHLWTVGEAERTDKRLFGLYAPPCDVVPFTDAERDRFQKQMDALEDPWDAMFEKVIPLAILGAGMDLDDL